MYKKNETRPVQQIGLNTAVATFIPEKLSFIITSNQ